MRSSGRLTTPARRSCLRGFTRRMLSLTRRGSLETRNIWLWGASLTAYDLQVNPPIHHGAFELAAKSFSPLLMAMDAWAYSVQVEALPYAGACGFIQCVTGSIWVTLVSINNAILRVRACTRCILTSTILALPTCLSAPASRLRQASLADVLLASAPSSWGWPQAMTRRRMLNTLTT